MVTVTLASVVQVYRNELDADVFALVVISHSAKMMSIGNITIRWSYIYSVYIDELKLKVYAEHAERQKYIHMKRSLTTPIERQTDPSNRNRCAHAHIISALLWLIKSHLTRWNNDGVDSRLITYIDRVFTFGHTHTRTQVAVEAWQAQNRFYAFLRLHKLPESVNYYYCVTMSSSPILFVCVCASPLLFRLLCLLRLQGHQVIQKYIGYPIAHTNYS